MKSAFWHALIGLGLLQSALLTTYFGIMHQGGVLPVAAWLGDVLHDQASPTPHLIGRGRIDAVTGRTELAPFSSSAVVWFHTYMPPTTALRIPVGYLRSSTEDTFSQAPSAPITATDGQNGSLPVPPRIAAGVRVLDLKGASADELASTLAAQLSGAADGKWEGDSGLLNPLLLLVLPAPVRKRVFEQEWVCGPDEDLAEAMHATMVCAASTKRKSTSVGSDTTVRLQQRPQLRFTPVHMHFPHWSGEDIPETCFEYTAHQTLPAKVVDTASCLRRLMTLEVWQVTPAS